MNTKILMTTSAIVLGLIGIILTFMPKEIINVYYVDGIGLMKIVVQLIGALYIAFAMLNWMSKSALIGGIYNRPLVVANTTHFTIGGLALLKGITTLPVIPNPILALMLIYLVFGITFGMLLFRHPSPQKNV